MRNKTRGKQGNALIYVVMVFAVIAILAMGAVYLASSNTNMTKMEVFQQQAYYTAKSNLDEFIASVSEVDQQPSYVELMQKLLTNKQSTSTIDVGETAGTATINLTCQEDDGKYCIKAKIESIGTYKDYSQSVSGLLKLTYSGSGEMFFASSEKGEYHTNERNNVYLFGNNPVIIGKDDLPVYKTDFLKPPNDIWGNLKYSERNKLLIEVVKSILEDNNESLNNLFACEKNKINVDSCRMQHSVDNYLFDTSKNDLVVEMPVAIHFTGNISFTADSKNKLWLYDKVGGSPNITPQFKDTSFSPLPNGEAGVVFMTLANSFGARFELGPPNFDKVDYHMFIIAPNTYLRFNNSNIYGGIIGESINQGFDNIGDIYLQPFSDNKYLKEIYEIIIGGDIGTGEESIPQVEASYE